MTPAAETLARMEAKIRERISAAGKAVVREKAMLQKFIENRRYLRNEAQVVDLKHFGYLQRSIAQAEQTLATLESDGRQAAQDLEALEESKKALARPSTPTQSLHDDDDE